MRIDPHFRSYETILESVDQEFDRNLKLYPGRILCQKGCSSCCSQMFHITMLEAAYISRAVKRLPLAAQEMLRSRAKTYLAEREKLIDQRLQEADPDESVTVIGLRLPCPALENDVCQIYSHRPIVCHKFGMPLYNPRQPDRLVACHLNFPPGEAIEDERLIPEQTKLDEQWQTLKARVRARTQQATGKLPVVTVADALLDDFETLLEEWLAEE